MSKKEYEDEFGLKKGPTTWSPQTIPTDSFKILKVVGGGGEASNSF
jgi:hypothetical protein